jgi:peptide/nickel transport system substrate-binding protein
MKKRFRVIITLLLVITMTASLLSACKGDSKKTSTDDTSKDTSTPVPTEPAKEETTTDNTAGTDTGKEETTEVLSSTPRNETLYFAGQQWGKINDWNPMSANSNNAMAINQVDAARELVYETLFMYNMLNGKTYGLLGTDYAWNADKTELTVHLNPAAKWSDGSKVTAEDVAYTFYAHTTYGSSQGNDFGLYISEVTAQDETTVILHSKLNEEGKPANPLKVEQYLTQVYVLQKAFLQTVEDRTGKDSEKFKLDTMEDFVHSGPYNKYYNDAQKVILIRDDNYWGQDASLFGKLPTPKYIAHTIYKDNKAGQVALAKGEVDVCQQFITDVQKLWEDQNLPISTYIDEPPYGICVCMPSAFFNTEKPGLDNVAVRKAIAMAVDFDQIIASAMSNQSPTFEQVPRSLMNPTDGEQAMVDKEALASYQFAGKDIDGANKLLDEAGIVDSDGDGWRDINGTKLSYKAECPEGWSDWNASLEIVAAAGKEIGIEITTFFPDADTYYNDFTTGNFDICMWSSPGAGLTNPWQRAMFYFSEEYGKLEVNWSGNFGHYFNDRANELLKLIPLESDPAVLKEYYTELSKIWLEEVPSFALMYRPSVFHAVNETVWTGYPEQGDGTDIPPTDCTDGYGIAALYNIHLVE